MLTDSSQNYVRDEILTIANARLAVAQNQIELAHAWGGGEVTSAEYFGTGCGVTHYNLVTDQFTGLNAITIPGTLRDSLILLAVALEQQTEF